MAAQPFLDTMVKRRTYYPLKNTSPIPDSRIQEIVKHAILHVPSSFNSQSSRIVVLLKEEHEKLWEMTKEVLKPIVPPEQFGATEQKLNMFKGGYGTVSTLVAT
jgi:predicted oxidoreductase (fatty acid repression mutant protein)